MTDKTQPEAGSTHIIRNALELGLLWVDGSGRDKVREALAELDALEAKLASIGAGGVQALSAAPANPLTISPLEEQQMFDDWCPYRGNPDPRTVWAAAIEAVNGMQLCAASPTPPAEQQAAPKAAPGEPVHGDVLPPVGSRVYIRHGRDNGAHACTVTGYYAWGDLGGDKRLHRVFVRLVYEGTDTQQARMLCDCHPTAEAALSEAAPQQEAQEPVATLHCDDIGYVWAWVTEVGSRMRFEQPINLYTAPQPAPLSDDVAQKTWALIDELEKLRGADRYDEDWVTLNKRDSELRAALAAQGGK